LGYSSEVLSGSVCPRLVVADVGLCGSAVRIGGHRDIERRGERGHGPFERAASSDMQPDDA
jgi:hypothetical protein